MATGNTPAKASVQSVMEQADDANASLWQLMNVVKLAAFACEARRVLNELESLCNVDHDMSGRLKSSIPACFAWSMHEDVTADVLMAAAEQMRCMAEAGDRLVSSLVEMASGGDQQQSAVVASLEGQA